MKISKRAFKKKINLQRGRCYYCGEILKNEIEIDHILPFSKHKNGALSNLCLSCFGCNRKKLNKSLGDFKKIIDKNKLIRGLFYFEFIKLEGHDYEEIH